MNFRQKLTLNLLLYIALSSAAFAQTVDIPDPNLRSAIADALGVPHGAPITEADMKRLTKLTVHHQDIRNLTGLEFASNLETLYIDANPIVDLSPVAGLTQLKDLGMWGLPGVDITPLANLTNLRSLDIAGCDIVDISPLDALALSHFVYNQTCVMPPLPVQPRLENRHYPSIFARWSGPSWPPVSNRPDLTGVENVALHDLWFSVKVFGLFHFEGPHGFEIRGNINRAIDRRDRMLAINPNMITLMDIRMRADVLANYPPDWPY